MLKILQRQVLYSYFCLALSLALQHLPVSMQQHYSKAGEPEREINWMLCWRSQFKLPGRKRNNVKN